MPEESEKQLDDELHRIVAISLNIREAIRNALPAPAEQFLTVSIPGKVLNLDVCALAYGILSLWHDTSICSLCPGLYRRYRR